MALFDNKSSKGGIMDVIRCDEKDYLIWKWRPNGQNKANGRANEIRMGSALHVDADSVAVFQYNQTEGSDLDYIVGPYDGFIETKNFPVLSSLVGLAYNGDSPFQAEIHFINLKPMNQIRFAIPFDDGKAQDYNGIDTVLISTHGSFNYKIEDYRSFYHKFHGDSFDKQDFENIIQNGIMQATKTVVSGAAQKYSFPVLEVERHIVQIRDDIASALRETIEKEYSVRITQVEIAKLNIKQDETYRRLLARNQNAVNRIFDTVINIKESIAIRKAASQKRLGTELNDKGETAAEKKGNTSSLLNNISFGKKRSEGPSTPPPLPISKYYVAVDDKQIGPFTLSQLQTMAKEGTFSLDNLVWKEGMRSWKKAGDIKEISSVIS